MLTVNKTTLQYSKSYSSLVLYGQWSEGHRILKNLKLLNNYTQQKKGYLSKEEKQG